MSSFDIQSPILASLLLVTVGVTAAGALLARRGSPRAPELVRAIEGDIRRRTTRESVLRWPAATLEVIEGLDTQLCEAWLDSALWEYAAARPEIFRP